MGKSADFLTAAPSNHLFTPQPSALLAPTADVPAAGRGSREAIIIADLLIGLCVLLRYVVEGLHLV